MSTFRSWLHSLNDTDLVDNYVSVEEVAQYIDKKDHMLKQKVDATLDNFDDRQLLNFCMIGKIPLKMCSEDFWMKRYHSRIGQHSKPSNLSWKKFYLQSLSKQ